MTSFISYRSEVDDLERTSIEDEVLDFSFDDNNQEQEVEDDESDTHAADQEVTRILPEDVVQTEYCIVSTSKVLELLYRVNGHICSRNECARQLSYQKTFVGTCLVVNWKCSAGHFGGRWAAQSTCSNLCVGNLLLASAIVLSGNSFTKIGFLFKVLNLKYFLKNLFNQYQNLLIAPVIDKYLEDMKEELWEERAGKDVVLSGDGRNDSPGHCA